MRQYWLGKTKPKQAFRSTRNAFNKFIKWIIFYWLSKYCSWLMPSDKRNLITAKATDLIFSLFDVASAREVPFGIPQYIQCILHGLTSVLLCVSFIFAGSEKCRFGGSTWWLPFITEIVCIFHSGYFAYRGAFQTVLDLYCCVTGWTLADNEV